MILINLLPPELRRARRSGINPVVLAAAAGILLVLAAASVWAWVAWVRIPAAEELLEAKRTELVAATARADAVKKLDQEIAAFEKLHGTVTQLITRKVFWARAIDDFANLLAQANDVRWTREGYEVRCTSLTIAKATSSAASRGAKDAGETLLFSFRANFNLLGIERDQAGDYVKSFFESVEASEFWRRNGFQGRAEDPYKGETPKEVKGTGQYKVAVNLPLEWRRAKVLAPPTKGAIAAAAPAPAAGGKP
jgi:hypothetical protein